MCQTLKQPNIVCQKFWGILLIEQINCGCLVKANGVGNKG